MTTTTDRPSPKPEEVWQHFKGDSYLIKRVSHAASNPVPCASKILHSETGQHVSTWYDFGSGLWFHDRSQCSTDLVAYAKPGARLIWGRPIDNFMAADERSTTGFKFWKIQEAPQCTH